MPQCLEQTANELQRIIQNPDIISNDHLSTVMCNGAITANTDTFNTLWRIYKFSTNQKLDKTLILKTIGCIEDRNILNDYLNRYTQTQDDEWFTVIQSVYLNGPIGLNVVMEFLNENFNSFSLL